MTSRRDHYRSKSLTELSCTLEPLPHTSTIEELWTALEAKSDCTFFLSWDWIGTWLKTVQSSDALLLTVRASDSIVALGIFNPARLRRRFMFSRALLLNRTGDPRLDLINIEYNDLLTDRTHSSAIWPTVINFLEQADICTGPFKKWDELHIAMSTQAIVPYARESNLMVLELAHKPSWFVDLDAVRQTGQPYLETISSNARYQIRRAIRLYERKGPITAKTATSTSEALEYFAELKELHGAYWTRRGLPDGFQNPHFEHFHHVLVRDHINRGTVELFRVSAGTQVIGLVYNFVYRDHVYSYQSGFHYDDDPKCKPGLVSHYLCLQKHLERGAKVYDFLAGDHRYKRTFGSSGPDLAHYIFQRRTPARVTETALRRAKQLAWR